MKMVINANPIFPADIQESLVIDIFLDKIRKHNWQLAVKLATSRTLHNDLMQAFEIEAVKQSISAQKDRVRTFEDLRWKRSFLSVEKVVQETN